MRLVPPFLLVIATCDSPKIPFPTNASRFTPPSIYREWWSLTQHCSGRNGSFDAISWYILPDARTLPGTHELNGAWFAAGNRIIISGADDGVAAGDLVRHEMLHAILKSGAHPRDVFVGRCGGVVACIEDCLTGGGPPSPPNSAARRVSSGALQVTADVVPRAPSSTTWDGYFMMLVSARNAANYPVVVQMPESGAEAQPAAGFSFDIRNARGAGMSYDMPANAPEITRFAPGERKQFVFDFHNISGPSRYDVAPGTWTFKGAYAGVWAATPPPVVVAP
jgi:hypothetical protein